MGKTGDNGIDGIIQQDALGINKLYIQAKKWNNSSVGSPQVRDFIGALHGNKANKGILITTSRFTKKAIEYTNNIGYNIVLIDGKKLVSLMMQYNLGINTKQQYEIKQIDEDFFI